MSEKKDPTLKEAIRQATPASVEYRLYYGDERVTLAAIESRLEQLSRTTAAPIAYRRVVSAFLRKKRNEIIRLVIHNDITKQDTEISLWRIIDVTTTSAY